MLVNLARFTNAPAGCLGALLLCLVPAANAQEPPEGQVAGERFAILGFEGNESQSFLGVNIWEINADVARKKNLSAEQGVMITSVVADSAADKAGLQKGDVVLEYSGERVIGVKQFIRLVRETPVGREVTLKVQRNGQEQAIKAEMGARKNWMELKQGNFPMWEMPGVQGPEIVIPDVPHVNTTWGSASLGVVAESLESQLAEYFGVQQGVLVRSVGEDTAAQRAGLKAGDVIVKVGDTNIATPREVTNAIRGHEGASVALTIMRNRHQMVLPVQIESGGAGGGQRIQRLLGSPDLSNL